MPGAAGAAHAAALDDAGLTGFELDADPEVIDTELAAEEAAALLVDEAVLVLLKLQPTTRVATHSAASVATA